MIGAFRYVLQDSGIRGLYRGAQSPLAGMASLNAVLFFAFGWGKSFLVTDSRQLMTYKQTYFAGVFAGFFCTFVEGPVDFFKCQLQMRRNEYRGFFNCVAKITREHGWRGFWQGFAPSMVRNVPAYGHFFSVYELTWRALARPGEKLEELPAWKVLLAGGMGGLGFWGPTYPIDVMKSSIQADSPDPKHKKYSGMIDCARQIYRTSGWRGFYKGVTPCMIRAFPANAAAWAGYEYTIRGFEYFGL
jgi:solute carrier family 25 carnitine/acylcarnitine transporter 20/29